MAQDVTPVQNKQSVLVDMRIDTVVRIALIGLVLGAGAWLIALGLDKFAIKPAFCSPETAPSCANYSPAIAGNIALVLTGIFGMVGLVRVGAYRPMLVVIAVAIVLWNVSGWLSGVVWYEALGWSALMYMAAYATFAWLVRPRNFVVVLILLAVLIAGIRFIAIL